MNPNNKFNQNGGQPSLNIAKNVENRVDKVCRDYVWGKCFRAQCNLPHECDIQTMLDILQICHDYQNSTGCKRSNCRFLHATREEEKLFREAGEFPSDLVKRHNQMNVANMSRKNEEPYLHKPPPPLENQQAPPPMLMMNPMYQPARPWFLQPPPPPPREPSPPPFQGPPLNATLSGYTPQLRNMTLVDTTKPPPLLPHVKKNGSITRLPETCEGPSKAAPTMCNPTQMETFMNVTIDTSIPPPPLHATQIKEKRALPEVYGLCEAGPSKLRKIDIGDTSNCENCMRWELRNLIAAKKKKEKLKEKGILLLQHEEAKKEITNILDLLKDLGISQSDSSSIESYDLDLYADPDNLLLNRALISKYLQDKTQFLPQSSKPQKETEGRTINDIIRNGQARHVESNFDLNVIESTSGLPTVSGTTLHAFPTSSVVSTHAPPPPIPQFTVAQTYRPVNNQFKTYYSPGPSNGAGEAPRLNTAAIPTTHVMPPFSEQNSYYMMDRPPPPFP